MIDNTYDASTFKKYVMDRILTKPNKFVDDHAINDPNNKTFDSIGEDGKLNTIFDLRMNIVVGWCDLNNAEKTESTAIRFVVGGNRLVSAFPISDRFFETER